MPQTQVLQAKPATSQKTETMGDAHTSAAICHEIAAQLHHDAAALHANGHHEQAGQCAKKAHDQGRSAMQIATGCCQYHTKNNRNN